jgi:xanthosine utilization system XapX-like protein
MNYVVRRLSSLLLVAGASLGLVSAVLAEAAGAPPALAVGVGLVLFFAGMTVGNTLAWRIRRHCASTLGEP